MSNRLNRQGLLLSEAANMAIQADQDRMEALGNLIHFRATCAMNNLGELIPTVDVDNPALDNLVINRAVDLAEKLMVKLNMVENQEFFRKLDVRSRPERPEQPKKEQD